VGTLDIAVTATEPGGLSAADTFTLTVANVNDPPVAGDDTGAATEDGGPVVLASTALLANDTDVDVGDTRAIVSVSDSTAGVQVSLIGGDVVYNASGLFQSLGEAAHATDIFTYSIADAAGALSAASVVMTITGVNDAPLLANALPDQLGNQNAPFHFVVPDASFTDIDAGDALSFTATLADGSLLPAWLAFDPVSRTLGGTPTALDVGAYEIRVSAIDGEGLAAADTFTLSISDAAATFAAYRGSRRADAIRTGFDNDLIEAGKGDDTIYSGAGRDLVLAGKGDDRVHAGYGNDYLFGGKGRDRLFGAAGNDTLFGGAGEDHLDGGAGNDVLDGGAGKDHLIAGGGSNLLIGGPGGDELAGGNGHDVFLFNRGDGKATLHLGDATIPGNTDTLSLGKDIAPDDLVLRRAGRDLLVGVAESGEEDDRGGLEIVLKGWYAADAEHRSVTRLQWIGSRIETYDFTGLVARFDAATRGRERHWPAGAAMNEALVSVSDSEAIGGALAHQYATRGTLAHVSAQTVPATLAAPLFGEAPQAIAAGGGATLEPYLAADEEEGAGAEGFVAVVSDPGVLNGAPLLSPETGGEVFSLPPARGNRGHRGKGSGDEERLESLIESWFDRARDGVIPLSAFLEGEDAWRGEHRRSGHGHPHPTQDEIAASWRRTQALLEAHLASPDPAALGGGEERAFSTLFGGLGSLPPALSGERFAGISGHPLRRLEGLEEGLSKIGL